MRAVRNSSCVAGRHREARWQAAQSRTSWLQGLSSCFCARQDSKCACSEAKPHLFNTQVWARQPGACSFPAGLSHALDHLVSNHL